MGTSAQPERVRPAALRPGDTVGVIAPSSGFRREELQAGIDHLQRLGYNPVYLPSIFDRELYFAGSAARRANELHEMFRRTDVAAILCARGGYGCNYLLPHLDLELIRAYPKIFAGCSDVTTLLTYLCDAAGLVTFHGPMVAGDFARPGGVDEASWLATVSGDKPAARQVTGLQILNKGTAEGILYGGCLSLLCASLGTPHEICTEGTVLFIEDRAERPYRVDRMLMQLRLAGKFEDVRGIVFGEMIDCNEPGSPGYSLQEVIMRIVGDLDIPVALGLKSGHVSSGALTLPFGVGAKLSVGDTVEFSHGPAVHAVTAQARVNH